jgi:hypothetical protein
MHKLFDIIKRVKTKNTLKMDIFQFFKVIQAVLEYFNLILYPKYFTQECHRDCQKILFPYKDMGDSIELVAK